MEILAKTRSLFVFSHCVRCESRNLELLSPTKAEGCSQKRKETFSHKTWDDEMVTCLEWSYERRGESVMQLLGMINKILDGPNSS